MKHFLYASVTVATLLAIILLAALWNFSSGTVPAELLAMPETPPTAATGIVPVAECDVAAVCAGNVFDPLRGKAPPETEDKIDPNRPQNKPRFELIGIGVFDDQAGAVIANTNGNPQEAGKRYFRIGENVGDGYGVTEIGDGKVVLMRGNEKLELTVGGDKAGGLTIIDDETAKDNK
ncbi:MAG: hypothetical protein AB7F40_09625 [Victivallaceae bacterium]